MVRAMPVPKHAPDNNCIKCIKCGGISEFRIWLENPENNKFGRFEVFECVNCGFFEWLPSSTTKKTGVG
jgi:Zn ribbon nucleic-acid-binding protein